MYPLVPNYGKYNHNLLYPSHALSTTNSSFTVNHSYGDTSSPSLPQHSYTYEVIHKEPIDRNKIMHGSDCPINPFPPGMHMRLLDSINLWGETNWLKRDVMIK